MAVTKKDYPGNLTLATKGVMVELMHILSEYGDHIVIIGGWVPELLLPDSVPPHVGSIDVDLVLNHRELDEPGYKTIQTLLVENGYVQSSEQPYIFSRKTFVGQAAREIQIDFLTGEYGGTGRSRRTQRVQDMRPRKARGADLVYQSNQKVVIEGRLPSGAIDRVTVKVASEPVFLVMKGMALKDRVKEKDAY